MVFSGNRMTFREDYVFFSGIFKVNTESDPKEIDLAREIHKTKEYVGTTCPMIYKIEGNKLFLVVPADDLVLIRPRKFENTRHASVGVFTKQQ